MDDRATIKRRKERQNVSRFDALALTPANLASGFNLPASAHLFVSTDVIVSINAPLFENGPGISPGSANKIHPIGYYERGRNFKLHSGAIGNVTLYLDAGRGLLKVIGTGQISALQSETQDWLNRVSTSGGTVSQSTRNAVDAFIAAAKSHGYFNSIARLNLFCGDSIASLVPQVNRKGAVSDTNNGTTYSETTGRSSTGATQYINTGLTPADSVGGLFAYLRTNQTVAATSMTLLGVGNSGFTQNWALRSNVNNVGILTSGAYMGVSGGSAATGAAGKASNSGGLTQGFWHVNRRSATDLVLWKNGTLDSSNSANIAPTSPTLPIYVFCLNSNGTAASGVTSGTSMGAYGYTDAAFTNAQMADFYTDMQAFQTALNRQV